MISQHVRHDSRTLQAARDYFASGWGFLLPYLAVYLLYAHLQWPIHPDTALGGVHDVQQDSGIVRAPSLLHVFWTLHALNVVLLLVVVFAWWSARACKTQSRDAHEAAFAGNQISHRLFPWVLLGILLCLAGVYLEWPADPWEHLRRINEWQTHTSVSAHSRWEKASYFFTYSIVGFASGDAQIWCMSFYSAGVSLLLLWQYFRLARSLEIPSGVAHLFLVVNLLSFGNSAFSFYRYYALSSTVFAQVGAIALIRVCVDATRITTQRVSRIAALCRHACTGIALIIFVGFNHVQGLGIAALGAACIVMSRMVAWRRAFLPLILATALVANIFVFFSFSRDPALFESIVSSGWLNQWLGFNVFEIGSPAFERTLHILGGVIGIANLVAGAWLLLRNDPVGWLTVVPLLVLATPAMGVPFSRAITGTLGVSGMILFHRMLFVIPPGLALVRLAFSRRSQTPFLSHRVYCGAALMLIVTVLLESGNPRIGSVSVSDRFWHLLARIPDDLQMAGIVKAQPTLRTETAERDHTILQTIPVAAWVLNSLSPPSLWNPIRKISTNKTPDLERILVGMTPGRADVLDAPGSNPECAHSLTSEIWNVKSQSAVPTLVADLLHAPTTWVGIGGSDLIVENSPQGSRIRSRVGESSAAIGDIFIPLESESIYEISIVARSRDGADSVNYFGIAWYDVTRRFLPPGEPAPAGAGLPFGWSNGNFSYFGLIGGAPPPTWEIYSITFGTGATAGLPSNAAFAQIGLFLNQGRQPDEEIEIASVTVVKDPSVQQVYMVPGEFGAFSPASQAAHLSKHWMPSEVSIDHAGIREFRVQSTRYSSALRLHFRWH